MVSIQLILLAHESRLINIYDLLRSKSLLMGILAKSLSFPPSHFMSKRSSIIGTVPMGKPYIPESQQSFANKQLVLAAVATRFPEFLPDAIPYVNILSFNSWLKRGYKVKKGEKAIRVAGARPVIEKDEEGQDEFLGMAPCTACVFCLPQVEPIKV